MSTPVDAPVRALEDVLIKYLDKPCTKELATQIVRDVLEWAEEYGVKV
jgi:DNA-binding NtrC family response regulator